MLTLRYLNLCAVVQRSIKRPSALWRQIQNVPNWTHLIDAALFDVVGQPRMAAVKVAQSAVAISSEH